MNTVSPPSSPPHYDGHSRPQQQRAISSMSQSTRRFSTSSRKSDHSANKLDLVESSKDKKRLHTKADPSVAVHEAQPAEIALEDANLEDLRKIQHKDVEGNVITDPDRSNPTRPRMERPLDTIRAFNAAAEGTSRSRASSYHGRPTSVYGSDVGGGNRRTSHYSNSAYGGSPQRTRNGANGYGSGYYRNSAYGFPQHNLDDMQDDVQYQPPPRPMRGPNHPYHSQQPSGYANGYANGAYPKPNDSPMSGQHSYETMTSGSDEAGKSTNPSSLNSSYDHLHQMQMRKQDNHAYENQFNNDTSFTPVSPQAYGNYHSVNGNGVSGHTVNGHAINGNAHQQNGNTQVRDYDPYSSANAGPSKGHYPPDGNYTTPQPHTKGYTAAPPNDTHRMISNPKMPIKFNSPSSPPPTQEKRKSWLKRTFSRSK